MRRTLLLVLALAVPSCHPIHRDEGWEPRKGVGFVNLKSGETKDDDAMDAYGQELLKAGQLDKAYQVFTLMMQNCVTEEGRKKSALGRAEVLTKQGRLYEAYAGYDDFVHRYPLDDRATPAKKAQLECARLMTEVGTRSSWLIFPTTDHQQGLELLRHAVDKYSKEDFAPQYAYWIGEYLFQQRRLDEAVLELESVQRTYRDSVFGARALLLMGECELAKFKGIDYDPQSLKDALKYFDRVIQEFPRTEESKKGSVRKRQIQELLAEKQWNVAMFYRHRSRTAAFITYLQGIADRFPTTSYAQKAVEMLRSIGQDVGPLEQRIKDSQTEHP